KEALDVLRQVSLGLEAAHRAGIVHRDIKPANVLITSTGTVKILDFGVAKLVSDSQAQTMTQAGQAMGTMLYMSPEQLRGESVDARNALWSLGVLAYEMLAGVSPFQTDSSAATVARILHDEPPSLVAVPGVPDWLARLVSELLRKNPAERPQAASEVLRRLGPGDAAHSLPVESPGAAEGSGSMVQQKQAGLNSWFAELKRRRVFRALIGYGIAAFAVLQIIEPVMHGLHWPETVLSYVVAALAAGFPVVITLAWIFDVKGGRIERTAPAATSGGQSGARLALVLIGISVLAAAPGIVWYFAGPGTSKQPPRAPSATDQAMPSIAVLPFADMSPAKDQEYFSDGIAEEILNGLAQIEGLRVIGRTSSFSFKGKNEDLRSIGDKLRVSTILEGSVRKAGNRLRITAQLTEASGGSHLWSQTYERELTDLFAVQDEIAKAVVTAMKVKLVPRPGPAPSIIKRSTPNVEAYNLYLKGRYFWSFRPDRKPEARKYFEQALQLDPEFAPAHAGLADWYATFGSWEDGRMAPSEAMPRAKEEAERALQIDSAPPPAHRMPLSPM